MRETKIRFGLRWWQIIQEEARADGVSASQFVREAAIARALYMRHKRGADTGEDLAEIIERLRGS